MAIGFWEVLLIFAVILIIFGPKRLPQLARSMGKAVSEFKKGQEEEPRASPKGSKSRKKKPVG